MISLNSTNEPGHPWVTTSGSAPGSCERTCRKWMVAPSMSVVNWGKALRLAYARRQP